MKNLGNVPDISGSNLHATIALKSTKKVGDVSAYYIHEDTK